MTNEVFQNSRYLCVQYSPKLANDNCIILQHWFFKKYKLKLHAKCVVIKLHLD